MANERYRLGDLVVDAGTCAVTRHTRRVELPPLSFALLVALLRRAGDVARRQELIDEVWAGDLVNDETLSQRVRALREALGDRADRPRYVAAVRGWGYRIALPVERLDLRGDPGRTAVAVLPFANLGGAAEDEPLCEGLAESIISSLTRVEELRVIARTSSFLVGRLGLDIREAGRRLGVGHVLEGSVRRSGQRVRVTVQLVRTSDGGHLWSEQYDRELRDVLELEDEIAEAVAVRLREGLAAGLLQRGRRAVDPAAYEAFLEGRYHFRRLEPGALARAAECFERSAAQDPSFAPAFDALAELHWYRGFFGGVAPREAFTQSTWCTLRALELDESLAETHALLAMLRKELDYNWAEVDRELARARQLAPSSPAVRLRSAISGLLPHGRFDEALAELDEVIASDPLSLFVRWWSGTMAYLGRRDRRTLDEGRLMVSLDATHFLGHWLLGMGRQLQGDLEACISHLERADELSGSVPFTLGFLAHAQGKADRRRAARASLDRLAEVRRSGYVSPFASALGHLGLGERDNALRFLDEAIEQRDPLVMPILGYELLDPLRGDPRFPSLLAKMNLEP